MKIKFLCICAIIVVLVMVLTGCSKNENSNSSGNENKTELTDNNSTDNNSTNNNSINNNINNTAVPTGENEVVNNENNTNESKSFDDKKVDKIAGVNWNYEPLDFSKLKWLKTEEDGNICIPENWNADEDVQALGADMIVYTTEDVSSSIIIKDCSASSANSEVQSLLSKMAADIQLEEWSYETIKIDGRNAVVVNAKFNGINHIQSNMFIATEDQQRMVVVCVESPDPNVTKLINTFSFKESNEDALSYFTKMTQN